MTKERWIRGRMREGTFRSGGRKMEEDGREKGRRKKEKKTRIEKEGKCEKE